MGCPSCGAENPAGARFCNSCGAPQAAVCLGCGNSNPPASRFCNACGSALGAAASPARSDAAPPSQAHTPRPLTEGIQSARAGLEGERKQITVLFADIVGSTALIEGRDPEEAQRLLDGAIKVMMAAVHRYEGTVSRLMGDGLMALFGAPVAHEDHAVRACYAALAMQDGMTRYAEQARERDGVEVGLRVGLNSGEVVVRVIADDLHLDYTALGQAVHLAARMEQIAAPGSIRLAAETLHLAEGFVEARPLGPMVIKGLSEPVEVAELVGVGAVRTRFQASASRGLTPFTGRQTETAVVREALERAGAGHGQVIALVGEPGVGKSRLVYEVTQAAAAEQWTILQCGAASHATSVPYLPVIDLLKQFCGIEPHDNTDAITSKVGHRLLALDPALQPIITAVLSLLDVPIEDAAWQALDPPGRRRRTLDAVQRLLLRQSQHRPLLLVVEDLHWIDAETQAVLDGMVEALPAARTLLLVNYRPEYTHGWGSKSYYTQLRIDPLGQESAEALLDAFLGDDPSVRPLKPVLIERTEGNPFFLEEGVRSLVETGALVGERGAYRLEEPITAVRVPATVQAVLAARIDRLPPDDKRLLQTASVLGKDVPFALLRAIADLAESDLQRGLSRLQGAEFLYQASLFPEVEYTFKHALTHEVAYGSLLQDRRRSLHARIVGAMEAAAPDDGRGPDQLAEQTDRLGHHALRGELWEQAVTYLRRAGLRDGARSANRQAAIAFEQALDALSHLPDRRETQQLAIDIRLDLRNVLLPLDEIGAMFDHLLKAERLAISLEDRYRLGWVSAKLTACYFNDSRPAEAEVAGLRAMAIADERADLPLQVNAHFFLGLAYVYACRWRESIALLNWNVGRLTGALAFERFGEPGPPAVFSRSYLLRALAEVGQFEEALSQGQEAVRLSESTDFPMCLASTLEGLGFVHLWRGNLPQAIALLERSLRLCEEWQFHLVLNAVQAYLGYAYALVGRDAEAMPLLEASANVDRGLHPALRITLQGEAHLLAGRLDLAQQCVDRALALAATGEEHGGRAWTLRLAAEVARARGPDHADLAAAQFQAAQALADERRMRPLQAHCHLGLGKLYCRAARADEARAELATAVEMLREMGMTFWLPEAEAELAEVATSVRKGG
jgi:class 3 adenylate cyclase/tetratricopeptide (TPR) repeat protein